ncbi:putative secreted protein [Wickerhamomyces ciferrii]|uniref:Secreted protein n=1 Tax=Wickerhamomyces ciferrii (strain ATCC 14091 / BCRC 22168 / CBS 111 / JCM 3599 / NBRC 0793 / NRRL Y-1031 F-60-10) TaxID=1206466 RepID=K0KR33_WICCF|nr:uncharacterized protein BN7_5179 [Wickerhamomyces ciferrii]CCH45596.1 putative secreted protein [Wickerhamomyces ciferrii]
MSFFKFVLLSSLTIGAFAWDIVESNQTDAYQYLNLVRCLNSNEPTSNTTVGLDSDDILFFNINAKDSNHSTYVFDRCLDEYANSTLIHYIINGDQNETMINATHISQIQNGSELFSNCGKPNFINDQKSSLNLTKRQKYSNYYEMKVSDTKNDDCKAFMQFDSTTDVCYDNHDVPFEAFHVNNPNVFTGLKYIVWDSHHDCKDGNGHTYTLPPKSASKCTKRKVVSWFATLKADECYDDPKKCIGIHVDHSWAGTYESGKRLTFSDKYYPHFYNDLSNQ